MMVVPVEDDFALNLAQMVSKSLARYFASSLECCRFQKGKRGSILRAMTNT
jgi:hypothetical protein